jgi:hypothetical protein
MVGGIRLTISWFTIQGMCKGENREIILNLAEHVPGFLILSYSLVKF